MKFKLILSLVFLFISYRNLYSQNIFPIVTKYIDSVNFSFVLDGSGKGSKPIEPNKKNNDFTLTNMVSNCKVPNDYVFKFQIIINKAGEGNVLSHTVLDSVLATCLTKQINNLKWKVNKDDSFDYYSLTYKLYTYNSKRVRGYVQRYTKDDFSNWYSAAPVVIHNKKYKYKNKAQNKYWIDAYTKFDSPLQSNYSVLHALDTFGYIWYATYSGLVVIKDDIYLALDSTNSPFGKDATITSIAVDNNNVVWVVYSKTLYSYDGANWKVYDKSFVGMNNLRRVFCLKSKNVVVCGEDKIKEYSGGEFKDLDSNLSQMIKGKRPFYVFEDSKSRVWIGTFEGSFCLDENKKIKDFNEGQEGPLKNSRIQEIAEDENGELYFVISNFMDKDSSGHFNNNEGLHILSKNDSWQHLTISNSGLPHNNVSTIVYDSFENIIWLVCPKSGLSRFQLDDNTWELYNNENSEILSNEIYHLSIDKNGILNGSSFYGQIEIKRRNKLKIRKKRIKRKQKAKL